MGLRSRLEVLTSCDSLKKSGSQRRGRSCSDYNRDETLGSLEYASRAKLITNDAAKNADSEEVAALKAEVSRLERQLLSGGGGAGDGADAGAGAGAAEEKGGA